MHAQGHDYRGAANPAVTDYDMTEQPYYERGHEPKRRQPMRRNSGKNYINRLAKYLLFLFNFVFIILGLAVIILTTFLLLEKDKNVNDALDVVFDPVILLCIAGCLIFVTAFFGALGSLRENILALRIFQYILTGMLVIEVVIGVLVLVWYFIPSVRESLPFLNPENVLKEAVVRYRDDPDLKDTIDDMQEAFQCCGISDSDYGYKDWQENIYFNCSETNPSREKCGVPHTCCILNEGDYVDFMCGFDTTQDDKAVTDVAGKIYVQGCLKGIGIWLQRNVIIVGGVMLGIIIPQIIGVCLARTLVDQIRIQMSQWRYT